MTPLEGYTKVGQMFSKSTGEDNKIVKVYPHKRTEITEFIIYLPLYVGDAIKETYRGNF